LALSPPLLGGKKFTFLRSKIKAPMEGGGVADIKWNDTFNITLFNLEGEES